LMRLSEVLRFFCTPGWVAFVCTGCAWVTGGRIRKKMGGGFWGKYGEKLAGV
jgi:hypothetical protein